MPSGAIQGPSQAGEQEFVQCLRDAAKALGGAHVVCYYSDLPNKPITSPDLLLCEKDLVGFVRAFKHSSNSNRLALILHTPGGRFEAVDMIVEYIHSNFEHVTAIIPHTAMSGGTLIALSCDKILIGRNGALGPIDPQIEYEYEREGELINAKAAAKDILYQSSGRRQHILNGSTYANHLITQRVSARQRRKNTPTPAQV